MDGAVVRAWLFIIACLIGGPLMCSMGLRNANEAVHAATWPTAPGEVQSVEVKTSRGTRGRETFTPDVKYVYAVRGTKYESDRIDFGDPGFSSQERARAVAERYRVGQSVTVHYDPANLSAAVLKLEGNLDNWLLAGAGFAMTVGAIFAVRARWRKFSDNESESEDVF